MTCLGFKKCCFCIPLKTAVLILGLFALIIQFSVAVFQISRSDIGCTLYYKSCQDLKFVEISAVVFWNLVTFASIVSMIYGSQKHKRMLMLPAMLIFMISTLAFVIFFFCGLIRELIYFNVSNGYLVGTMMFLIASLVALIYSFFIIGKRYKEINEGVQSHSEGSYTVNP